MKRAIAVLVIALVVSVTGIAWGSTVQDGATHHPLPKSCTVQAFRPFSKAIWAESKWERGNPPQKVLEAVRRRENCAPPAHRKAMKATWERDRASYFEHRHRMIWLETNKPFVYPSGRRWATPYPIAICESGENYYASPWGAYGLTSLRPYMSPREQDEEAHRLYVEHGEAPWAPYESGCYLR